MSDNEVQVVKNSGRRLQWAAGWFYQKEGEKFRLNSKVLKVLCGVCFLLITITTMLSSTDVTHYNQGGLDPSEHKSDSEKIKVLDYLKSIGAQQRKANIKAKQSRSRSRGRIRGTKLVAVSRSGLDKIPPGSEAMAVLLTGGTDGAVKARLTNDLEVAGELFLPEGTVLMGLGASGDERLAIGFHTAVFENGKSQKVGGIAYDQKSRLLGLSGSKMGRRALKMASSAGLNFVAGASQAIQDVDVQGGIPVQRPSLKNALLSGSGLAAIEQSKEMMEGLRNKQAQIYVKAGTKILVVFQEVGR